jgi:Mrp family chromosome partitioning ATPase
MRRIGHVSPGPPDALFTREEFRVIKRPILAKIRGGNQPAGRDPRVILVTSAARGEGKSFVAQNLALSIAIERGVSVTLIDGDVVTRGLTRRFNLSTATGLLDALHDERLDVGQIQQGTNIDNFKIIPAGGARSDAAELISGDGMTQLLGNLARRSNNQVIIMDSGAILSGSLPTALASHAGQIMFVIASNETRRADIEESLTLLDTSIGSLEDANVGLVLNKISPAQSTARYSGNPR